MLISNKIIRICTGIFIVCTFNACIYNASKCQKLITKASTQSYDLVVVPGASFDSAGWGKLMKARIYWAKYLYDEGIAKNIMFSGSAVYTKYCEAEIMAMYAHALGIPKQHIFTETKAEHSTENIYYSYKKAKKMKFNKIALATDAFQGKYLSRYMKKDVCPEMAIIPMPYKILKEIDIDSLIDPKINIEKAVKKNFVSLKERENYFKRIRGSKGKNIKLDLYQ